MVDLEDGMSGNSLLTLRTYPSALIRIACPKCRRAGQYSRSSLTCTRRRQTVSRLVSDEPRRADHQHLPVSDHPNCLCKVRQERLNRVQFENHGSFCLGPENVSAYRACEVRRPTRLVRVLFGVKTGGRNHENDCPVSVNMG